MPVEEAIVMVLVFAFLSMGSWGIISTVLQHRRKMAQIKMSEGRVPDPEKEELRETVSLLQDRLTVLETIATDPARRTADEIEKLR